MFTQGIFPIGDGLLDIDEDRLKGLLVPHDINEIYDVEQTPFARGKFAAVRRAIHKNSGVHFAAKFLKRRRRAQSSDKEIKHEIAVLMLCDGAENIVKLNAVHETRADTALLLELATGGELQTLLDNEECLSEAQARNCMRQVLKALQFLHKRSIAHLDLKPQNILLAGERIEDGLKLCDFGISRVVAEGTNVREIVGTPDYVAPEVLQYEPLSLLTDIWSVGVLAYVLLSGFSPFGGDTKQETFLNISQCALTFPDKLFNGVSSAAIDFIKRALRIKPNERMSAAGCLEHKWLKDECDISRQPFNGVDKQKTFVEENAQNEEQTIEEDAHNEHEYEDDDDDEEDDDDDENENDENEVEEAEYDLQHAENETCNDDIINKMESSDIELEIAETTTTIIDYAHNAYKSNGTKIPVKSNVNNANIRHTNIPLQPTLQQQQLLQFTARRQPAMSEIDCNKENSYLANKQIASTAVHICKKSTATVTSTATATASIVIQPGNHQKQQAATNSNEIKHGNNMSACLFPDAPTTPKVIRKASTAESSPTSVKALVKKFQLEGKGKNMKAAQVQEQQQAAATCINGTVQRKSNSFHGKSSVAANAKYSKNADSRNNTNHQHSGEYKKNASLNGSIKLHINASSNGSFVRRCSEPITGVHHKKQLSITTTIIPTSATATVLNSYKSTCVVCLSCGGSNTNAGCRHSVRTTVATTLISNGARRPSSSNSSTNSNGSSSSCESDSGNVSPTSNGSSSLLLQNMHHHHHRQLHHHHMSKNTNQNMSQLDQGIIC